MSSDGLYPPPKHDRRTRIKKLEIQIKNKDPKEKVETIIARFALLEGLSLRTIREYLKFLKLAGKINEDVSI